MTNVLIVEDERLVCEMLCRYVNDASDRYKLVQAIKNADDAELFCLRATIDLILMDVCTAGNSSGLEAAARIKSRYPGVKIIIITSAPEYRFIEKAKKAGAESFWYKDFSEEALIDVMDKTMEGESVYPDMMPEVDLGFAISSELTPRELETLYWLIKLGSVSAIAKEMNISIDGVNKHIRNIKDKTGISSTNQLAIAASSKRLIMPDY